MKQDIAVAEELRDFLLSAGARPWLDKHELVLGDAWESEIKTALRASDACLVCLREGFDEKGFRQREVRWALEELERRPPGKGFVIPFLIEPCKLPHWCEPLHAGMDLEQPTPYAAVLRAIDKHCGTTLSSQEAPPHSALAFSADQLAGARELLTRTLGAGAGDRILLVCDETSTAAASCISHVAVSELSSICEVRRIALPKGAETAARILASVGGDIQRATSVVLLGAAAAPGTAFRMSVLDAAIQVRNVRTVFMPGVTVGGLSRLAGSWPVVAERAKQLAGVIRASRVGELTTQSDAGVHLLRFELGEHVPVAADGLASPSSWLNLPAGEAYVIPNHGTTEGEIAIAASMPGYVFQKGKSVVLTFRRGKVRPPIEGHREARRTLERLLFAEGDRVRSPNCTTVAEVGVGTNHTIRSLTGAPFLDEKRLGVVHVGLGSNTSLGGPTRSRQHIDLMTTAKVLTFDGVRVVVNGRYML